MSPVIGVGYNGLELELLEIVIQPAPPSHGRAVIAVRLGKQGQPYLVDVLSLQRAVQAATRQPVTFDEQWHGC